MSAHKIGKPATAAGWKRFLGRTAGELTQVMGDPFVAYSYKDEEIYLYDSKPATTIAIRKGLVVRCNDTQETRRTVRVRPVRDIKVIARGEASLKGILKDISVAGAAVLHTGETRLSVGSRVQVSLVLPIDGADRFLEISGRVRATRTVDGSPIAVFMFDLTNSRREKRLLSRYALIRKTEDELGLNQLPLWG